MRSLFTLVILFVSAALYAQSSAIAWQKCLGGSSFDNANAIHFTSDGGYIIAGTSNSADGDITANHGSYDYWVVKTSAEGDIEWQKSYGGSGDDEANQAMETSDGGFIIVGYSFSNDGDVTGHHGSDTAADCWLVKVDHDGNIQWQKSYGGSNYDYGQVIRQTPDGGYVFSASISSVDGDVTEIFGGYDTWLVKIDSTGNIEWQKTFGGSNNDEVGSLRLTPDGGYILAGGSNSVDGIFSGNHGAEDFCVIKLNASGDVQWHKMLGGSGNDDAFSVEVVPGGGYIVSGSTTSDDGDVTGYHGELDCWVVKLNDTGGIAWQSALGGSGNDIGNLCIPTEDGGYMLAASTTSNDGDLIAHWGDTTSTDAWMVKLDAEGAMQWQQNIGGTSIDDAAEVRQTSDSGYIIAGGTASNDIDVSGQHGFFDVWLVKLKSTLAVPQVNTSSSITISPNPTTSVISVQSGQLTVNELTDITGKIIIPRTSQATLDLSSLSNGVYLLSVYDTQGNKVKTEKVVKE